MLGNCPWVSLLTHLLGEQQLGHLYFLKGDYPHLSLCMVCKDHEICLGITCGQRRSMLWIICPLSWWIVGHFSFFFLSVLSTWALFSGVFDFLSWHIQLLPELATPVSSYFLHGREACMALDKTTLLEVSAVAVEVKHHSCINAESHISSNAKTSLKNFTLQHPGMKQFHS